MILRSCSPSVTPAPAAPQPTPHISRFKSNRPPQLDLARFTSRGEWRQQVLFAGPTRGLSTGRASSTPCEGSQARGAPAVEEPRRESRGRRLHVSLCCCFSFLPGGEVAASHGFMSRPGCKIPNGLHVTLNS